MSGNAVAFTIVIIMFAVVTLVGFAAARWLRAEDKLRPGQPVTSCRARGRRPAPTGLRMTNRSSGA